MASQKKTKSETWNLIKELDWETIFFLIGIFVVVGAISGAGLLSDLAKSLYALCGGQKVLGFIVILLISVLISGFVDNVPYIMVMLPMAQQMAVQFGMATEANNYAGSELFMFALLIGSCLGGNLTPFGASANVVAMGIVKKEGYPMNFGKWLILGGTFTVLTTAASAGVLWLLWS